MDLRNKKILIAFFSRKGQNYAGGKIIELKKGNTAVWVTANQIYENWQPELKSKKDLLFMAPL